MASQAGRGEPTQTNLLEVHDPKVRQYIRGLPDCVTAITTLIQLSKNRIRLWTPSIDVALYSHAALMAHFKNLALKNKHTHIEILLTDSRSLVEQGHLLLELSRRLPSSIQIKRAAPEQATSVEEVLLIDDRTVFFRPNHSDYHAWACLDDILADMGEVAEGVETAFALERLIKKSHKSYRLDLKFPIIFGVAEILRGDRTPREGLEALMGLQLRPEFIAPVSDAQANRRRPLVVVSDYAIGESDDDDRDLDFAD